jgi:hypothetical protein
MNDMGARQASEKASAQITAEILGLISKLSTGNPGVKLKLESQSATSHVMTMEHDWYGLGSGIDKAFGIVTRVSVVTTVVVPRGEVDES